jgi:hypothetical protein
MPDPTPTLTEIAAEIRKHAPGAMPESLHTGPAGPGFFSESTTGREKLRLLPDYIARHVLIAAMVMDMGVQREWSIDGEAEYWWHAYSPALDDGKDFPDSDHGNDPLLSLYAAWRWARGIE